MVKIFVHHNLFVILLVLKFSTQLMRFGVNVIRFWQFGSILHFLMIFFRWRLGWKMHYLFGNHLSVVLLVTLMSTAFDPRFILSRNVTFRCLTISIPSKRSQINWAMLVSRSLRTILLLTFSLACLMSINHVLIQLRRALKTWMMMNFTVFSSTKKFLSISVRLDLLPHLPQNFFMLIQHIKILLVPIFWGNSQGKFKIAIDLIKFAILVLIAILVVFLDLLWIRIDHHPLVILLTTIKLVSRHSFLDALFLVNYVISMVILSSLVDVSYSLHLRNHKDSTTILI